MNEPSQPPLIDRESELATLERALSQAVTSRSGQFLSVIGPRGVGKTRVVQAFVERCKQGDIALVSAECSGRDAEALLPVRDALRSHLGTTQDSIRTIVKKLAPDLLELVPVIGRFLAQVGRDLAEATPASGNRSDDLHDVLASLILKLGDPATCLIVENVHRADSQTLSFLKYFTNKSRHSPSLTIVTVPEDECQEEVMQAFLSEMDERGAAAGTIDVPPLGAAHIAEFISALFRDARPSDSTIDFALNFTGGNLFLLVETLRALESQGILTVDNAVVQLTAPLNEIPPALERLLERRLARLEPTAHSLTDVTAVLAETSQRVEPIFELAGMEEPQALDALKIACDAGILAEREDGRIVFTSDMLRLAAYSELGVNRRLRLHLRAAEWFEANRAFSEAAHHFERAGDQKRMVAAALMAAEAAEHVGMYQKALDWYRKTQPLVDARQVSPRLVTALLAVGNYAEAERVLGTMPQAEPATLLLRSDLCFLRGEVTEAAKIAFDALSASDSPDLSALLRLADLHLYLGRFREASSYAERALETARSSGDMNHQARCLVATGAAKLFAGEIEQATTCFDDGLRVLEQQPEEDRNEAVHSALLGNRASVDEITEDWQNAETGHRAALKIRLDLADARGVVESVLALARVCLGKGDLTEAEAGLAEARHRAEDLGEDLQLAKIIHHQGQVARVRGDADTAVTLVEEGRRRFEACGTSYDVAYTELDLAAIYATRSERDGVSRHAAVRATVERNEFWLLSTLFPSLRPPSSDRIRAGLLAYAAGDALGLPWEGKPPSQPDPQLVEALLAPEGRAAGSTSDDTALTLLVAEHLVAERGMGDPQRFLQRLVTAAPTIQGLGPSTVAAVQAAEGGQTPPVDSNTNGAAMRALPIGWALGVERADERRSWAIELSSVTHRGPEAVVAACVVAACASWALERASAALLLDIAVDEALAAEPQIGAGDRVSRRLAEVRDGVWAPPPSGVSLDPADTIAAVLACIRGTTSLRDALLSAVMLGGDTDTVASLVGGLLGCSRDPSALVGELPWMERVVTPAPDQLTELATGLAVVRLGADA